jgi:hypothetical protein
MAVTGTNTTRELSLNWVKYGEVRTWITAHLLFWPIFYANKEFMHAASHKFKVIGEADLTLI